MIRVLTKAEGELALVAGILRSSCKGEPDLMERIRKAMRAGHESWMSTDEDLRFRASVAAAILESPTEEQARIKSSFAPIRAFSALLQGVPVDMARVMSDLVAEDAIPLIKMWDETKPSMGAVGGT